MYKKLRNIKKCINLFFNLFRKFLLLVKSRSVLLLIFFEVIRLNGKLEEVIILDNVSLLDVIVVWKSFVVFELYIVCNG